ncbi:hypothetical protein ACFQAV_06600 [Companilactobacillus huachuanensis]|uniref:Bacteriocin n=1 Tax=Companilactobacillus huachuanensis TaxID=2559914 RepID=A0ABW1RN57_9LACO|nr:hypothetical protein [Companilactobacillus huachuanensis]
MKCTNSFEELDKNQLLKVYGGNRIANWIIADAIDAYSNMVHYQHMKPSPINN